MEDNISVKQRLTKTVIDAKVEEKFYTGIFGFINIPELEYHVKYKLFAGLIIFIFLLLSMSVCIMSYYSLTVTSKKTDTCESILEDSKDNSNFGFSTTTVINECKIADEWTLLTSSTNNLYGSAQMESFSCLHDYYITDFYVYIMQSSEYDVTLYTKAIVYYEESFDGVLRDDLKAGELNTASSIILASETDLNLGGEEAKTDYFDDDIVFTFDRFAKDLTHLQEIKDSYEKKEIYVFYDFSQCKLSITMIAEKHSDGKMYIISYDKAGGLVTPELNTSCSKVDILEGNVDDYLICNCYFYDVQSISDITNYWPSYMYNFTFTQTLVNVDLILEKTIYTPIKCTYKIIPGFTTLMNSVVGYISIMAGVSYLVLYLINRDYLKDIKSESKKRKRSVSIELVKSVATHDQIRPNIRESV